METIGFGGTYYTLWYVYEKDGYVHYDYVKNISTDREKAERLYPEADVDMSLKGNHSFTRKIEESLENDCFKGGMYKSTKFEDCHDDSYNKDSKYAFMFKDYIAKRKEFYKKLTDAGVKAYRVHDGWVDTDLHKVTFFNNPLEWDTDSMYYHPKDTTLQVGDLIFIGNYVFGGRFARITEVLESTDIVQVYRYAPLYDYMDGLDKFITKFTYPTTHTPFFERLKYRLGIYKPKFQSDII